MQAQLMQPFRNNAGRRLAAAILVLAAGTAGCSTHSTPDYSSLWTTSAASSTEEDSPTAAPTPIAEYLESVNVKGQQVPLDKLTDITVTLPRHQFEAPAA